MHNIERPSVGILLCLASMFTFAIQDIITKSVLLSGLHLGQVLVVRYMVFTLFAVTLAGGLKKSLSGLRSKQPVLQVCRSSASVLEIALINTSFLLMPIARTHAIVALFPIITLVLAWAILHEKINRTQVFSILLGFIGSLVIIGPDVEMGLSSLVPLGGAMAMATYSILSRYLSWRDSLHTHTLYMGFVGLLITLPFGIWQWQGATTVQWMMLLGISALNIAAQLFFIQALKHTNASVLQPYNYTLLVFASIFAFLLLGEVPALTTLAGGMLIIIAGLIMMNNTRRGNQLRKAPPGGSGH
jgi:drug/metabolite transporter (DMT)-like permease